MAEYTPFGLAVKTKLLAPPRTQEWLVSEINKDTGMNVDSAYTALHDPKSCPAPL